MTAFAWFAVDPGQCVGLLWERLQSCADDELRSFFSRATFALALRLGSDDSQRMLPLVPPEILASFLTSRVTESADFVEPSRKLLDGVELGRAHATRSPA